MSDVLPAPLPAPPSAKEIEGVLDRAVRAPSVLNTQPWRFVVDRGSVLVYADRERQLTALDPDGREMTMSVGAAVYYLRVAARHAGWTPTVLPFPVSSEPDLVAAVTFARGHRPGGDDRHFRALALRRTNRHPFTNEPVPFGVAAELAGAVADEGAALRVFDGQAEKDVLSHLVAAGIIDQGNDCDVVDDINRWLRPAKDPRPDGVRDSAQGMWDRHASMRTPPSSVAAHKGRLVREAPAVLVLYTKEDERTDWLAAGQALARALVVAADRGLAASYANEPVEVASLRPKVADLVGGGFPQVVFRVGYPEAEPESSRRFARDVTERAAEDAPEPLRGVHPGHAIEGG